jgi:hypothetical protein
VPIKDVAWEITDLLPNQNDGSAALQYLSPDLQVVVSYPLVSPESTVFTINLHKWNPDFTWNGLVDAYGRITEISIATVEPTPTPTLLPTATPVPTNTPIPPPTATPQPTKLPIPTLTPTLSGPCNRAGFIGDVTIPDGANFAPETRFLKTWRLQNTGSCTWTRDYNLVFIDGERMGGPQTRAIPHEVRPGESLDISVDLVTPAYPGKFRGSWMLRSQDGEVFGVGFTGNQTFYVILDVLVSKGEYRYDFGVNFCEAIWRSDTGRLSCSNTTTDAFGVVRLLDSPPLESGVENQHALRLHPNEALNSWIDGTYPYTTIKKGDRFRGKVGCLEDYGFCNLTFYLDYVRDDGSIYHLGRWKEVYDGKITTIDIDLSDLAGESVRFILGVETNTGDFEDAEGFWLAPRIVNPEEDDEVTPV